MDAARRAVAIGALVVFGLVGGFVARDAGAVEQTASITASSDTYVHQAAPDVNEGGSPFLQVQSPGSHRALVEFDLAAIEAAAGNGTLVSATLQLEISENFGHWGDDGQTVDVHRLTQAWAEGNGFFFGNVPPNRGFGAGATWNCAVDAEILRLRPDCSGPAAWRMFDGSPDNPWIGTPADSVTITDGSTGIVEWDVTADVQAFMAGTADNYGWIIRMTGEDSPGRVQFTSLQAAGGTPPTLLLAFELTPPEAGDDAYDATGNVLLSVDAAGGVLANDSGSGISITNFQAISDQGGEVDLQPDGSFTYNPPAGFTGADVFEYTISNDAGSDTGRVDITVSELVWFVDNTAAGPEFDGRFTSPFDELADAEAASGPGDYIFIYTGDGTTSGQNDGITLQDGQLLIGQGVDLVVSSELLVAAAPDGPVIGNTAGDAVTVANDNVIAGLSIDDTAGHGIVGTNVSGFQLSDATVGIDGVGDEHGIFFSNLTGTATFENVTVDSAAEDGLEIRNNTGTLDALTIANSTFRNSLAATGEHGVDIRAEGTARMTVNILDSTFEDLESEGVLAVVVSDAGASLTLNIEGSAFDGTGAFASGGVLLSSSGTAATATYNVIDSQFLNSPGTPLRALIDGDSSMDATLMDVTVDGAAGNGVFVRQDGEGDGRVLIDNLTVGGTAFDGVLVDSRDDEDGDANVGSLDITITNSNVSAPATGTTSGIQLRSRDGNAVCADISANVSAGAAGGFGYQLSQEDDSSFALAGFAGDGTDPGAVAAFIEGNNVGGTATATVSTTYTGMVSCNLPS